MRKLRYHLVDVFTSERFGGNPLAVFTNGRGLSTEVMQRIARELNLSETTFVLPPDDSANDWKVRIFTPAVEMPMAGHPTIGTSYVLASEHLVEVSEANPVIRLEEIVGTIPVTFTFENGEIAQATMQQPNPTFGPTCEDRQLIAEMLSLEVQDLADYPLEVVSCGLPFMFVPLKDMAAIQKVRLRSDIWERASKDYMLAQMFMFTQETVYPASTVHSRMFGPGLGIAEDPATGAASGPLGCYLVKRGLVKGNPAQIISEQGFEMGRPSFIHIEIGQSNGVINSVKVGGQCVPVGEGVMEL